jgi:carbamate kinase
VDFVVRVVDEVASGVELDEVESHGEGPEVGVLSVAEAISSATKEEFIKLPYSEKVVDMTVVEEFEELRGELSRRLEAR